MPRARFAWIAASFLLGLPLVAVAAWGCVPQPLLSLEPSGSAPPGTEVTVKGADISGATAELRWNDPEGPLLAKTSGRTFSVPVKVPEVPEGLYAIMVIGRLTDGSVSGTGRASLLVTAADGSAKHSADAPAPDTRKTSSGSSSGRSAGLAAAGAGLLGLGAVAGVAFSRRSRRAPAEVG